MASSSDREKILVQVLKKIPIFKGLAPTQVRRILSLCQHRNCEPGEKVCESGSRPAEMFVLLSGELAIITPEGLKVATILPVTTVGEMGVVTGLPRVATVQATRPSALFAIQKAQFDAVLREDRDIQTRVFRAIIDILSDKLANDNVRLRDHQRDKARGEGRISVLERRLEEQQARVRVALDLAAAKTGLDPEVLAQEVDEQVQDLIPRVLVVDDEVEFRVLVKEALPRFEVVEAANGREALGRVEEEKLDLVITDIRMPEMDGLELLDTLRDRFPQLKVLAASGYLDAEAIGQHPFDGFVEKPLDLQALRDLVDETVDIAAV